jgi:hypothetical protein
VERPKDVFNPSVLNVRLIQGVASYLTSYQQTVCLRRHPIELKKRNATPLRSGWWLRVTYCYVAYLDAYGRLADESRVLHGTGH